MNRAVSLSPELASVVGAPALSRPEVMRRLWAHFRDRGLLNPDDKREVLFDAKLQEMFGTASTKMFEIHSLLTPHFDYTSKPAEIASCPRPSVKKHEKIKRFKADVMPAIKKLEHVKHLPSDSTRQHMHIHTAKAEVLLAKAKHEQAVTATHVTKPTVACHNQESSMELSKDEQVAIECAKAELIPNKESPGQIKSKAQVSSIVPRICDMKRTSARVEFTVPVSCPTLEVVAVPITMAGLTLQNSSGELATSKTEVRATCSVEFREVADGDMEPYAEAQLLNLQPDLTYRLNVRLQEFEEGERCNGVEVRLPQRAYPTKWTPHEALLWSGFLRVPEFASKVKEYGIDGATLLTLGDEDLSALGISAPFLRRRIIAALGELRTA